MHGTEPHDCYASLSSQNPGIVKNGSIYIYQLTNAVNNIKMFALYKYLTLYYVL